MYFKVGLLFSFTGTTSLTERGQYEAAYFAITQYNEIQKENTIEAITKDISSDPAQAAKEAEALAREGIKVFVGCYTSACRIAILPILEKYNCLLVYPTLYEGQEDHPNVLYTGEVPNQQVHTLIDYLMNQYGKKIYLIGNDYVYPKKTNSQVKLYVKSKNGEIIEEKYVPFGHREFHHIIQDIILKKPDAIFSSLVGQSVIEFYQTYKKMGLDPEMIPIFSPITKETELSAMGAINGEGHYSSASYFQSLDNPKNKKLLKGYRNSFGKEKVFSSVMFNTYLGTDILIGAVTNKQSLAKDDILEYLSGKKIETACGTLRMETNKRHLSRPVRIGKASSTGQFNIVWDSEKNIQARSDKVKKPKKQLMNEIILQAWGEKSEEAIIAVSKQKIIQYMSKKAKEITHLNVNEKITPENIKQLKKTYEVNSSVTKSVTLLSLKPLLETQPHPIYQFGNIQTKNEDFQRELETATIAAESTANVLILGETGTGKEVLARSIHKNSDRKNGPFIAVNTGAIPKDLIASELFGYIGGTFTGARTEGAIGKFESADKGTLFLDEIGDMPYELQVILLRAIETKKIIRLGESREREVDIRIIAATNKDLEEEIAYNNGFRSDLYYRLNVLSIDIPPLRERPEDIEALVWKFMNEFQKTYEHDSLEIDHEAIELLTLYPWSGNVRELRNIMERAFLLARGRSNSITINHLPKKLKGFYNRKTHSNLSLKEVEEKMVNQAISETANISDAAKKLGIGRSTLYRKLKEFEISI